MRADVWNVKLLIQAGLAAVHVGASEEMANRPAPSRRPPKTGESITYVGYFFESPSFPCRQLHDLCFQPLLRCIPRDRLREHHRLLVGRYPRRDTLVWKVAYDISIDCGDELIMKDFRCRFRDDIVINPQSKFILVELTYEVEMMISIRFPCTTLKISISVLNTLTQNKKAHGFLVFPPSISDCSFQVGVYWL